MPPAIVYANVVVKQRVEAWSDSLTFDPDEQIMLHLAEKFGASSATIEDARPEMDFIVLTIRTDVWSQPRELALLRSGSFAW